MSFGAAFPADAGGFGSVGGFDSPVAVSAFELAGGGRLLDDFFFFDFGLGSFAGGGFFGGHGVWRAGSRLSPGMTCGLAGMTCGLAGRRMGLAGRRGVGGNDVRGRREWLFG